ncbi:hypothetical protein [Congregicoccus parvus]
MESNDEDPEVQRKAQRALTILYVLTASGVVVPLVLWWIFGR